MIIALIISLCLNFVLVFVVVKAKRRHIGTIVLGVFDGVSIPYLVLNDTTPLGSLKHGSQVVLSVDRETL